MSLIEQSVAADEQQVEAADDAMQLCAEGVAEDRIEQVNDSPFEFVDYGAYEALKPAFLLALRSDPGHEMKIHLAPTLLGDTALSDRLSPIIVQWQSYDGPSAAHPQMVGGRHYSFSERRSSVSWRAMIRCPLCGVTFHSIRNGHTSSINCSRVTASTASDGLRALIQDRLSAYQTWALDASRVLSSPRRSQTRSHSMSSSASDAYVPFHSSQPAQSPCPVQPLSDSPHTLPLPRPGSESFESDFESGSSFMNAFPDLFIPTMTETYPTPYQSSSLHVSQSFLGSLTKFP